MRRLEGLTTSILQYTQPGDIVVADEQMLVFRADRVIPPALCDTSFVRIRSGCLNDAQAIQACGAAKMVIFASSRLNLLQEFTRWVQINFERVQEEDGISVYLRRREDTQ